MMRSNAKKQKLHLGCGDKYLPGYINIDGRKGDNVDLVCNMTKLPYDRQSIDEIYMCHTLEHVPLHQVMDHLIYLNNLLTPSGCIYISVPDFQTLSSMYLAQRCQLEEIVRAIHGGQEYEGNLHYISFDESMLRSFLINSNFKNVEKYEPIKYLPCDFTDTSTYKINGISISLNMKATK